MSAISDFNMVCQHAGLRYHYLMVKFLGAFVGSTLSGLLSDLYGRKLLFLSCILMSTVSYAPQIMSSLYWVFLAAHFFEGVFSAGIYTVGFVYVMEIIGPNYRMLAGIVLDFFWISGLFILLTASYWIRDWKLLVTVLVSPNLLFISYIW
ncbi:hypothetical protein EGW08_023485 [Elysia chlorotica]|uniref:Major facilitator superfamily (MFS) profile domain-containing protein n=1 Tax=Elysia chlorotica TaxID=188477 RepID=A0A3S0Z3V1_ELYCH|nr:hypothetical protein EGW08_023485 [Elysia chlorotica]